MPIEFRCSRCGKLLRTPDGSGGRQAQCPECGTIGAVPGETPVAEGATLPEAVSQAPSAESPFAADATAAASPESPFQPTGPAGYQAASGNFYADAAQRVSAPGTALVVVGWLGTIMAGLLALLMIILLIAAASGGLNDGQAMRGEDRAGMVVVFSVYLVGAIVAVGMGILMLVGGGRMKRLESYNFAMTAAIVALVPCVSPCGILSLPFGIWALIVLSDSSVKAAFRR